MNVGIIGFGKIGRRITAGLLNDPVKSSPVKLKCIVDRQPVAAAEYLYNHKLAGKMPVSQADTSTDKQGYMELQGNRISYIQSDTPPNWSKAGVDLVVDSSGVCKTREDAELHLEKGASLVLVTSLIKDADIVHVFGVNSDALSPECCKIISNASCTTNCLTPFIVALSNAGIQISGGLMATIHAYTSSQPVVDNWRPGADLRMMRAAAQNIIPTSTKAAEAVGLVLPEFRGKLTGVSYRVPVVNGSALDFTFCTSHDVSMNEIHEAVGIASRSSLHGILESSDDDLVSTDILGNPNSCIYDKRASMQVSPRFHKALLWYDNECGYASRCIDTINLLANNTNKK